MLEATEFTFSCHPVTDLARARKRYEGVPDRTLITGNSMADAAQKVVKAVGK